MREILANHVTEFLSSYNSFFHTEKEIQILLAQYLLNTGMYDSVYVEYYVNKSLIPNYPWNNDKKISIDIVVRNNQDYIPLEIKFKTKAQTFPHQVFGSQTNVRLENQSAKNEGCYSFWKDIKRIEIFTSTFNLNYSGFVLFITNDNSYEKMPREGSQYAPFSIHQDRQVIQNNSLNWDPTRIAIDANRALQYPGIAISNNYTINWQDSIIPQHKYVLI